MEKQTTENQFEIDVIIIEESFGVEIFEPITVDPKIIEYMNERLSF